MKNELLNQIKVILQPQIIMNDTTNDLTHNNISVLALMKCLHFLDLVTEFC